MHDAVTTPALVTAATCAGARTAAREGRAVSREIRASARSARVRAAATRACTARSVQRSLERCQRAAVLRSAPRAAPAALPDRRLVRHAPGAGAAVAPAGRLVRRSGPVRLAAASGMESSRALSRRCVRDANGTVWDVWELDARRVPASRGPRCLIFDCASVVRRVWSYPASWEQLSDGELVDLLRTRS